MKRYSIELSNNRHQCKLCHLECILADGGRGACRARECNADGVILSSYGQLTTIAVEPIEKKPIFHFSPGSKVLSVGAFGCNMDCVFCQNSDLSQSTSPYKSMSFSPAGVVQMALKKKCEGICMSFSEPTIHYEYLMDLAEKSHASGLYFALNTNAFLQPEPWADVCEVADAINIDYKGDTNILPEFTSSPESGHDAILNNLTYAIARTHVEVSIPIFGGYTKMSLILIRDILAELAKDTPVYLVKLFPSHEFGGPIASDIRVLELREFLKERLGFVYVANIPSSSSAGVNHTVCPDCGERIVTRHGLNSDTNICNCENEVISIYESDQPTRIRGEEVE